MFHVYRGELAGVATAALWTVTALVFSAAGKRIGATIVNLTRIVVAILLLAVTHRLLQGVWIPDVNRGQVFYLALSGVVGLAIGDQALPRISNRSPSSILGRRSVLDNTTGSHIVTPQLPQPLWFASWNSGDNLQSLSQKTPKLSIILSGMDRRKGGCKDAIESMAVFG